MTTITNFLKRHALPIGILLMYLFTWTVELGYVGVLPIKIPFIVFLFLGWGFVLASVLMTWITLGRAAVAGLLKRFLLWRVGWVWYLVAIVLAPALQILAVILNAAITHTPPDFSAIMAYQIFGDAANLSMFILPFFLLDMVANGEEIGWRGYVLPRLQARYSALTSSLIIGVIWSLWHLPKYLPDFNLVAFGWFTLHILAFAILLTWLYNNTKGSLLLVTLCHASSNTMAVFLPLDNLPGTPLMGAYILFVLLELVAALVVTVLAGAQRLAPAKSFQNAGINPQA